MRTSMPRELQIVHALCVLMLKKTQVAFAQSVRRASRASWSWRDAQIALHCRHRFRFIRVIICLSPQPQQCVGDAGEDGGGRVSFHQYHWIEGNSSKEMQGGWLWFTLLVWAWWVVCVLVISPKWLQGLELFETTIWQEAHCKAVQPWWKGHLSWNMLKWLWNLSRITYDDKNVAKRTSAWEAWSKSSNSDMSVMQSLWPKPTQSPSEKVSPIQHTAATAANKGSVVTISETSKHGTNQTGQIL